MYKLSKFYIFLFVLFSLYTIYYIPYTPSVSAQVPGLHKPACGEHLDPEFHSLRPYQAAPCGDAPKAYFCSNDLIFIESFEMANHGDCTRTLFPPNEDDTWFTCDPDGGTPYGEKGGYIEPHTLTVTLDDSMFPIMGNTEDQIDDATKVNNYMSWYLSGVSNKKETGIPTDDQIVNYSGPVNKLIPSMIQEAERIKTIESVTKTVKYKPEGETEEISEPENHDQVVVCAQEGIFGIWGKTYPEPCDGGEKYRLRDWEGDLSALRGALNWIVPLSDAWNKRTPPLPWDDGTVEKPTEDNPAKPFASDILYKKAYNEWQGKSCAILPIIGLQCIDNPLVKNKWAELYHYIPLSNNTDKTGAEYIMGDGPSYTPDAGTILDLNKPNQPQHADIKSAPLYMAHTKEIDDLTRLLNKTYAPQVCRTVDGETECNLLESKIVSKTTEFNNCSALTVRTNKGDNLFPGDPHELQVIGAQYRIIQATCHETLKEVLKEVCRYKDMDGDGKKDSEECKLETTWEHHLDCPAQITIKISTGTKTTYANPIYSRTVADSGSTFRKMYPKVEEGAPVNCIADIPTITDVTYEGSNTLPYGDSKFKVKRYPEDGAGEGPQLTFPHIGSMYEYFLNGIQTALRPKGYGTQPVNGVCLDCDNLPNLPKASGSCSLGGVSSRVGNIPPKLKEIVEAAAETYKVPPNLILGIMYGEGLFNPTTTGGGTGEEGGLPWSDYNVTNWATCSKVPRCNEGEGSDNFIGFYPDVWKNISKEIKADLLALDPNRIKEPSRCNLLDAIYGLAWNLHDSADGSPFFPENAKCIGIPLNRGTNSAPDSCDWQDHQYNSAIRVSEFGTGWGDTSLGFYTCATKVNSCFTGGGEDAQCETDTESVFDTCNYTDNSHNKCVFDVAHGN